MNSKKMFLYGLVVAFLLPFFACNKEKSRNRATVISHLKSSAKLATVEFVITKVIRAKKNNFLIKDAYYFAESQASIKAGIDLEKLGEKDVEINDNKVTIHLPPVEIINFSYPVDSFKVNYQFTQNPKLWYGKMSVADIDTLYKQGESEIRKNVQKLGITKSAQENTRKLISSILENIGFEEVYIDFKTAETLVIPNGEKEAK